MRNGDFDPEGKRLPIKLDSTSNGEFAPPLLTKVKALCNQIAREAASDNSRRLGMERRAFLISAAGAASTLAACNIANQAKGARGGGFAVPADAPVDQELASAALAGDEFIFDAQTHCVDPAGAWAKGSDGAIWRETLENVFQQALKCKSGFDCYSAEALAKEVFLDADTDAAVVTSLWGREGENPTPIEYAAEARDVIAAIGGEKARGLIHGGVLANESGQIESMDEKAQVYKVDAWKMYPQWGPDGTGFFLDESDHAERMFEAARRLGITTICAHKGIALPGLIPELASPRDMGSAAVRNPDLTFITYHCGIEIGIPEGAYDPVNPTGIDRLIKSHQDAGLKPNQGNLYAELGSVWRFVMGDADAAAHVMGKLLKYFGEDRIMWGTDSIWYGSPQDQILTFRTFEISEEFQERYGYPALTRDAKAKIFGLNAASVYKVDATALKGKGALARKRAEYRAAPNPSFVTFGPTNRRDFLALWKQRGGRPG